MTKTQKRGKTMDTSKSYLSKVVKEMPDSGKIGRASCRERV